MFKRNLINDKEELNKSTESDSTKYDEESSRDLPAMRIFQRESPFLADLKFFGAILQSSVAFIYLILIAINILNVNFYCSMFQDHNMFNYRCVLEKCHYILMSLTYLAINALTSCFLYYDYLQAKKGGYRLSDYFLYFSAWAGAWIPMLIGLSYTNYKYQKKNPKAMLYYTAFISLMSITTPGLYVLLTY